jgi:FlaA1/EpsC-like NDP-sugar epimerase
LKNTHQLQAVIIGKAEARFHELLPFPYRAVAIFQPGFSLSHIAEPHLPVLPSIEALRAFCHNNPVAAFIFPDYNCPVPEKNQVAQFALEEDITLFMAQTWPSHKGNIQLAPFTITDLFSEPSQAPDHEAARLISGKRILITGAAGSIGSELARQIVKLNPQKLYLLDRAETPLVELEQELQTTNPDNNINQPEAIIADITNYLRMEEVFKSLQPDMVLHAAAYKHVPILERFQAETLRNNTLATKQLALLAIKTGCQHFIFISTDKAVNPKGVMGISKRLSEKYLLYLNHIQMGQPACTHFAIMRFGNVLGSNGSVVPIFERQIAQGGPVTITNPEATRYFVSLPKACFWVLQSLSVVAEAPGIFIFNMGNPVKVAYLAQKMIALYKNHHPESQINVVTTSLRQGEKLNEVLSYPFEKQHPTRHGSVIRLEQGPGEFAGIENSLQLLEEIINDPARVALFVAQTSPE